MPAAGELMNNHSDYGCIIVETEQSRARITLHRAAKRNAMGTQLHHEMSAALKELSRDPQLKVLVLTGEADTFCSGMDLEQCFLEPFNNPDRWHELHSEAIAWFNELKQFPAVTVAVVNGLCFGGGVELVGLCDVAIASDNAVFGLSEINFGIFPGGGTMWAVAHHLGRKQALWYALTGERFTAVQAQELGLVNRTVPATELSETTEALLTNLEAKHVEALRATKRVYERSVELDFRRSAEMEMAMLHQLSYRTGEEWIRNALAEFKRRSFRPGTEPYSLSADPGP